MTPTLVTSDRWQELTRGENERNAFVQDLLNELELLHQKIRELEEERDCEKESKRHFYKNYRTIESQLKLERQQTDSHPFVIVLIDGNCMNFLDSLVQKKEIGGQEAAQELRNCVTDCLRQMLGYHDQHHKIMIIICCNLRELSKISADSGVVERSEDFRMFAQGFNMAHSMCFVVDAGSSKKGSDDRLRELFDLYVGQIQCKHVFFGASGDDAHARVLRPYAENDHLRERITVLEGPPWAPELATLVPKFNTARFSTVFRETTISTRQVASSTMPLASSNQSQGSTSNVDTRPQKAGLQSAGQPVLPGQIASNIKSQQRPKKTS